MVEPKKGEPLQKIPRAWWVKLTAYLAIWLLVLTVLSAQTSWGIDLPVTQAVVRVIRDWGPWILLGPLLWWLVKQFPLFGKRKWQHIGIHLLASVVMIALAEVLVAFAIYPVTQPLAEKAEMRTRDMMRALRGGKMRPAARVEDYRLRPREIGRKTQLWLLLYWVFVLIGTSVLQRRVAEERTRRALILKNDLTQARFREFQSRLNPHFLFNVLNSINALIGVDPEKAEQMVSQLSTLLRRVLTSSEKTLIPLSEELSLLRDYLSIEQVRFSDRLTITESIDETALVSQIPPLTLQPIAENAIKHGIEPKSDPSELQVIISKTDSGDTELVIADDGVGFSDPESSVEKEGFGIGLQSVRDRLENVFPGTSSLTVSHREDGGIRVTILIPSSLEETIHA
ncbi:MAG: histidine kinase [Verrucomicrobiota bacterium]